MSWDAMVAVMDGSHADGAAFACLLAVAKSATEMEGWATYLSLEEIAERARLSVRGARKGVRGAEAIGELHCNVMHGRQGVNLWRLETGLLMRAALERYPRRRYNLDATGNAPERGSGGRNVVPPTPERSSATPERSSLTPERSSPGEGSRGLLEGEGEGARTSGRRDAAEPPPGEEVEDANGSAIQRQQGVASSPLGRVSPKGEPTEPWDEAWGATSQWERVAKMAGVQVHNGQGLEWAAIATEIGCETREEAGWMLRTILKLGRKEQPGRKKPWAVSELIGFKDDLVRLLRERRTVSIINQQARQQA